MLKKITSKVSICLLLTLLIFSLTACAEMTISSYADPQQGSLPQKADSSGESNAQLPAEITSLENADPAVQDKPLQQPADNSPKEGGVNTTEITRDEALNIALADAGLKKADVRDIDVELDYERSLKVYEVDFESGGFEYSYDINAISGEIVQREKELDD